MDSTDAAKLVLLRPLAKALKHAQAQRENAAKSLREAEAANVPETIQEDNSKGYNQSTAEQGIDKWLKDRGWVLHDSGKLGASYKKDGNSIAVQKEGGWSHSEGKKAGKGIAALESHLKHYFDHKRTDVKKEEVDIDELSKKTLGSYVRNAAGDAVYRAAKAGLENKHPKDYDDKDRKKTKQLTNRDIGIGRAVKRLTKEGEEVSEREVEKPIAPAWKHPSAMETRQAQRAAAQKKAADQAKATKEAVEITELSKGKLQGYVLDASKDFQKKIKRGGGEGLAKRAIGIKRAVDKIKEARKQGPDLTECLGFDTGDVTEVTEFPTNNVRAFGGDPFAGNELIAYHNRMMAHHQQLKDLAVAYAGDTAGPDAARWNTAVAAHAKHVDAHAAFLQGVDKSCVHASGTGGGVGQGSVGSHGFREELLGQE